MNTNILLTDEFAEFSGKITALHERKKEMLATMKKLYDEHKFSITEIDNQAKQLQTEFEEWSKTKPQK